MTPPHRCVSLPCRFRESASGVECDVCVTTRGCDFKGSVMRLCHQVQPSLAPLIRLVGSGVAWAGGVLPREEHDEHGWELGSASWVWGGCWGNGTPGGVTGRLVVGSWGGWAGGGAKAGLGWAH